MLRKGKFAVTESLVFPTLQNLVKHFEKKEIPGDKIPSLYLQYPILVKKQPVSEVTNHKGAATGRSSPKTYHKSSTLSPSSTSPAASPKSNRSVGRPTPPSSPQVFRKKSKEGKPNSQFTFERTQNSPVVPAVPPVTAVPAQDLTDKIPAPTTDSFNKSPTMQHRNAGNRLSDPADRPPMPIPRVEPIYEPRHHHYNLYATPDDPDRDRFYQIKALCQQVDDEIAKQSKKCTCGLYLYQSTLVDDWMMHRDIEETPTKGKIFFVNTATNEATWQLPNPIRKKMEQKEPDKWRIINAVLQSENAATS